MAKFNLRSLLGLASQDGGAVDDIEQSRVAAEAEVAAAEAAVTEAQRAYTAGLLTADDVGLRKLVDSRADASVRLDRARALLAAFDEKLAAARELDRQAEVARVVGIADAAIAEFREVAEIDLPLITEAARRLIRLEAMAHQANAEASKAIAASGREADYPQRPDVSGFRSRPAKARELVGSVEEVELWVDDRGQPIGDPLQAQIVQQSDGSGSLRAGQATYVRRFTAKRRFTRSSYRPAVSGLWPDRLATALAVPGLRAFDQPEWTALETTEPSRVLARLDELGAPPMPRVRAADGEPVIELQPIGPAFEVAKPRSLGMSMLDELTAGPRT